MKPDRAFWITWYDLPEDGRGAYLAWAHEHYMPRVLQRPGVLWGAHYASESKFTPLGGGGRISHKVKPDPSVPTGDRYIMIFGGAEPHVFANPSPREFHASVSADDRAMLAKRVAERVNIMIEEARVESDEAQRATDLIPAPCIQLGSFNVGSYEGEEEMAAWYARWRLPSLQALPGCLRVRKLVSIAGWAKHACFYEFTSLAAREEHFVYYEKPRPDMVKWSTDVVRDTVHAPGSANVATRLYALKNET
jgi:hypothetical protein